MKFVWFDAPGGGRFPVNPHQVAYLRPSPAGLTCIVFGGVTGGLHELVVADGYDEAVAKLEGSDDEARYHAFLSSGAGKSEIPEPVEAPLSPPASPGRAKRRTPKA